MAHWPGHRDEGVGMNGLRHIFAVPVVLSGLLLPATAGAAPCVGDQFAQGFPGASGVVTKVADVPSSRFPGFWQEGFVGGLAYIMFANGEVSISEPGDTADWSISLFCDAAEKTCVREQIGTPPALADRVAVQMELCFTDPAAATAPSLEEAEPEPEPEPVPEPEPEPDCGIETLPESDPTSMLQRLLILAGADPGPVDGLWGRKTRQASIDVIGERAQDMSVEDLVLAVDASLCKG